MSAEFVWLRDGSRYRIWPAAARSWHRKWKTECIRSFDDLLASSEGSRDSNLPIVDKFAAMDIDVVHTSLPCTTIAQWKQSTNAKAIDTLLSDTTGSGAGSDKAMSSEANTDSVAESDEAMTMITEDSDDSGAESDETLPLSGAVSPRCAWCAEEQLGKRRKCSACAIAGIEVYYCNANCQKLHWKRPAFDALTPHKLSCYKMYLGSADM